MLLYLIYRTNNATQPNTYAQLEMSCAVFKPIHDTHLFNHLLICSSND